MPEATQTKRRTNPSDGHRRAVIEGVKPEIDDGRFPAKRTVGEALTVEADVFTDGHDAVSALLLHRFPGSRKWQETPMSPLANDRWRASFSIERLGSYEYSIEAWVDHFATWQRDLSKKVGAGQQVSTDLLIGSRLVLEGARRATGRARRSLQHSSRFLRSTRPESERIRTALDLELARLMSRFPDRHLATRYDKELKVTVDRERARFSTWYEMFPRSCGPAGAHGTFRDCEARLAYIADMGFDVLYFPPIHPIGVTKRKGRNNTAPAGPGDRGSPWAIGSEEGGHKSIHPALGTLEDFRQLIRKASQYGIEIALDIAYQCSPDHPYLREHPEWFRRRPDGSIQFAENPPKKYEDIVPFDFECRDWKGLWTELLSIFLFWIEQGVQIFRVDNPHTKPFSFWEWVIAEIRHRHPEVIFLSEAFTRPRVMYRLAKVGFTQSYTYFAWRNTRRELTQYFTELTRTEVYDYFRPHAWPNTPDILTEYLQTGGRPAFIIRLVLAATLSSSYGIYGPAFELCEESPRERGSEEYLNSEKYEIREWDLDRPDSLREIIARINRIRRDNPALHSNESLRFHPVDNEQLICYSKRQGDGLNVILVVVNLDPYHTQSGWVDLPVDQLGIEPERPYQAHDLLSEARYIWKGGRNFVELNPHSGPAHIFRIRRHLRTEHDFEYFL